MKFSKSITWSNLTSPGTASNIITFEHQITMDSFNVFIIIVERHVTLLPPGIK